MVRLLKGIAAVLVLITLIFLVSRYWGDYRAKSAEIKKGTTTETTPTAPVEGEGDDKKAAPEDSKKEPEDEKPATKMVQVTIDGLNFRKDPSSDSPAIRGLNAGEKLKLLKEQGGWYQVQDDDGVTGWVSSNKQYTKVVQ